MSNLGYGPLTAKTCILVDFPRIASLGSLFTDWERNFLENRLRKAGFVPSQLRFESLLNDSRERVGYDTQRELWKKLEKLPECQTVITLGNNSLKVMTGKSGIDKWQCSPLDALDTCPVQKVMPTFPLDRITRQYELNIWLDLALHKAKKYEAGHTWTRKNYNFKLNPRTEVVFETLDRIGREPTLAVDIETGRGQINTVGFAWSDKDAIAINVLPKNYTSGTYQRLWEKIGNIIEGPSKKVMQNGVYEVLWFSHYGLRLQNFWHDTMWCQKMLWPELEKGLAAVGRIYTMEPYWKDEGKAVANDGNKKDWGDVRDWEAHYRYNCLDTTGTYEAHRSQLRDIEERGMRGLWEGHISRFTGPIGEMCTQGLPIIESKLTLGRTELEAEITELRAKLTNGINPSSPKQKKGLFLEKGYKIPKARGADGKWKESTNELSLKKMRLKYPEDEDIKTLLEIGPKQKALSSYFNVEYRDDRVTYMLDGHGTETGRWACRKDHLNQGFNAQTLPKYAKKFIGWDDSTDRIFIQCDLAQAESRFVAYDSADAGLIEYLEDETKDIHSYVASEIFRCSVEQVVKEKEEGNPAKRQLGKKSGHGANYSMKETTFMDSCLKELDLVIDKKEAKNVLEAYHRLFPGIRKWHERLRQEVRRTKKLENPFGRVRYFYGRMDDDTFREAYAYRPQSTVPDITNTLMLKLWDARTEGEFDFIFHLQVHDSVIVSCREKHKEKILAFMKDTDRWHPRIILPAGQLVIPVSTETGKNLGAMCET